jgi:hypothetical protein
MGAENSTPEFDGVPYTVLATHKASGRKLIEYEHARFYVPCLKDGELCLRKLCFPIRGVRITTDGVTEIRKWRWSEGISMDAWHRCWGAMNERIDQLWGKLLMLELAYEQVARIGYPPINACRVGSPLYACSTEFRAGETYIVHVRVLNVMRYRKGSRRKDTVLEFQSE